MQSGWRDRLHEIIFEADTPAGKAFDIGLIIVILLSVAVVVVSTMPEAKAYEGLLVSLEWVFTAIFTVEYVLRLIVVRRPLRYATSFFGIIDLLSILPVFVGLFIPGSDKLLVVRTLRLLRIFRVLKLTRYLSEAAALNHAIRASRHKIAVFITTVLIVVLIASAIMHIVEQRAGNEAFESMPDAMYWAVITMTTVGYGDITPMSAAGKVTTMALVLVGYSLIIVPTGILTAEIAGTKKAYQNTQTCRTCMLEGHAPDAVFCRRCGHRLDPSTAPPETPPPDQAV